MVSIVLPVFYLMLEVFMKIKVLGIIALLCVLCLLLAGCQQDTSAPAATETPEATEKAADNQGEPFAEGTNEKDFSALRTPGSQESAYEYKTFFLPAIDGIPECIDPLFCLSLLII